MSKLTSPQKAHRLKQIKLAVIGGLVLAIIIIVATALSGKPIKKIPGEKFVGINNADPQSAVESALESRFRVLEKQVKDLSDAGKEKDIEIDRLKAEVKSQAATGSAKSSVVDSKSKGVTSTETQPAIPAAQNDFVMPPKLNRSDAKKKESVDFKPSPFSKSGSTASPADGSVKQPSVTNESSSILTPADMTYSDSTVVSNDKVPVKERYVKNKMAGFLPATSAIPVVIYTGIDAITGSSAQSNPQPVHFRFQDDAVLPGNAEYRLTDCRGVATGFGELSSVRVQLLSSRIVCIDVLEDKILETKISGFITDSDGVLGLRGDLENREGTIFGKAVIASFVQGSADLLSASAVSTTAVDGVAYQNLSAGAAMRGGLTSGTSSAAEMLADRYIEQMKEIMPVIPLAPGRRGVLHISEGQALEWQEYSNAYTKIVEPVTKGKK